jgi:CRISPR-associated protein Cas2
MAFWVIDLENGSPRVRGALSRWAVEVRAGLYVGTTSAKTRDAIWKVVRFEIERDCRAVLLYPSAQRAMGFEARTLGYGRRELVDFDGLQLARFLPAGGLPATNDVTEDAEASGEEELDDDTPPHEQ